MVSTSRKEVRRPSAVIANNNSIEAAFDNKLTNAWGKKPAVLAPKKTMKPRRKGDKEGRIEGEKGRRGRRKEENGRGRGGEKERRR